MNWLIKQWQQLRQAIALPEAPTFAAEAYMMW